MLLGTRLEGWLLSEAALPGTVRERYSNDVFFAATRRAGQTGAVDERVFYASRPRPAPEVHVMERGAATPLRYATILFLAGWTGILFQAGFFQQVVFGAPVFEELAKFGPALLAATLLRTRSNWVRLPLAWLSGAAFGVMEHYVTYAAEPLWVYVERVAFHGGATGLSMLVYGAVERIPDVRARWGTTLPATLLHWAFNFGAVVLGLASLLVGGTEVAGGVYAVLITTIVFLLTIAGIVDRDRFEETTQRAFEAAMPRLGLTRGRRAPAPGR